MKTTLKTTILASLLATAMSASFAAAPTAALNHDPATYRNMNAKAAADYKLATSACKDMSGNPKIVCMEEAKAARAHAEADAVAQYNNTSAGRARTRNAVADADFAVAKARCLDATGAEKDSCLANAAAVHSAAIADVKADRAIAGATPVTAADKTRNAVATVVDKAEVAADKAEVKSAAVAHKTGAVIADSVITTKVKADIFKAPELKSMAIHVETDKGVVMLSGFVDSKTDADKAVAVARNVEGVASVQSAIKVK